MRYDNNSLFLDHLKVQFSFLSLHLMFSLIKLEILVNKLVKKRILMVRFRWNYHVLFHLLLFIFIQRSIFFLLTVEKTHVFSRGKPTATGKMPASEGEIGAVGQSQARASPGSLRLPSKSQFTNRFHVAVPLFRNRSQMTSKCGKNKKVAHECVL